MTKPLTDLALVLSGGGARGAFQAGAWAALSEDERFGQPTILSGTSAGAINSALIATGRGPEHLKNFWFSIADDPPAAANGAFFGDIIQEVLGLLRRNGVTLTTSVIRRLRGRRFPGPVDLLSALGEVLLVDRFDLTSRFLDHVRQASVLDTARLRERLIEYLGGESLRTRHYRIGINAVDAASRSYARYVLNAPSSVEDSEYIRVDAITVDMLLGSASVPVLFAPIAVDSALLWDGGILVTTPMAPAITLGAQFIIPVLVAEPPQEVGQSKLAPEIRQESRGGANTRSTVMTLAETIESVVDTLVDNTFANDRRLLLSLNAHPDYRRIQLYEPIRPARSVGITGGSYFDFTKNSMRLLYDAGLHSARQWLASGPPVDNGEPARPKKREPRMGAEDLNP
ncbi:MAG TPA: patatin-like phospholipase family protein [Polyangiaceae bacterium]|nr:patatin-like phospholipase family protein [Polyangiaceae bacterium]